MLVLIPVTFFGTLLLAFVGIGRHGFRQSFVYAATAYTLCLVCVTEIFSIWNLLRLEPLLVFWTGCTVLSVFSLSKYGDWGATRQAVRGAAKMFRASGFEISAIVVILALVLLIAVVAPPNNWESMVYRMTRVVMWMQQGSIAHYPTPNTIQLFQPPLSAWNILHFQILSGGDRFANTIQWVALAGCGVLASLIAKELKQSFPTQILAAVIAVTLPMGLVQGSSTQGNLVMAFWLLAFVVFTFQYFKNPSRVGLVCGGLAFGFTLLSKGTAYAIVPAVAATLWLCGIVRTTGYRCRAKLVCTGMGVVLVALLVNGGHYTRNWDLFGHPLGMERTDYTFANEQVNVFVLMANLVRNAALHWGGPNETLNALTLDTVLRVFGETIDNIPGSTLGKALSEIGIPFSLSEYHTSNLLHFWFLAASLPGILLFRRRGRFDPWTVGLALSVVLGALAFCGILQWEQWNSRYHTPLFMLGAPLGAAFASSLLSREKSEKRWSRVPTAPVRSLLHFIVGRRRSIVAGTFVVMSIPWIICNDLRPLYPVDVWQTQPSSTPSIFARSRTHMYFNSNTGAWPAYAQAIDFLAAQNAETVGLYDRSSNYNYPLWPLLKDRLGQKRRLEYVGVSNITKKLRDIDYAPPFIFSTEGPLSTLVGKAYHVVLKNPLVSILATTKVANEVSEGWKRIINTKNLLIRSHLEVYLDRNEEMGNRLVYVKKRCQPAAGLSAQSHHPSAEPSIFLHVIPADVDDLPDYRRRFEFDNLDFHFNDYRIDLQFGERCIAVRNLPAYNIVGIVTGESIDEGRLWEAAVSFNE